MSPNPARALLEQVAAAASFEDAYPIISASSIPLDANFYEKLLWQVGEWQNVGDGFASIGHHAFNRLWEFRFRRTDVDHWATVETQAFIKEMLRVHDPAVIQRFAIANTNRFSPNIVEGLLAADVFITIEEKSVRLVLNDIADGAAHALGMRLIHLPPKFFRDGSLALFEAYQSGYMRQVLTAIPANLFEQVGFTIAGPLDRFEREERIQYDRRITMFVNFMEALAKHLGDGKPAPGDHSHNTAIYIYDQLITFDEKNRLADECARAVANRGETEMRRDRH